MTLHESRSHSLAYWILIPSAMPREFAGRCAIIASEIIAVATLTIVLEWRATGTTEWFSLALAGVLCAAFFLLGIPLNEWMHRRLGEPVRSANVMSRFGTAILGVGCAFVVIGSITGRDWIVTVSLPFTLFGCAVMLFGLFTSNRTRRAP